MIYRQFLYISNILSLARIFLIIPVIIFFHYKSFYIVIAFSLVLILTDFLDGYLARTLNQVTDLGKALDPLADKIVIAVFIIYLAFIGKTPFWFLITLLSRDAIVFTGGIIAKKKKGIIIQSNVWGKMCTGFLSLYFLSAVIDCLVEINIIKLIFFIISIFFLSASTVIYFINFLNVINEKGNINES